MFSSTKIKELTKRSAVLAFTATFLMPWFAEQVPAAMKVSENTEQTELTALYDKAKTEAGPLTVYMGGDAPGQWNAIAKAFSKEYPGITLNIVVDLSKYHDARIDNQIATKNLVVDVAILQTLQDFDRWKKEGRLLRYKPVGWSNIYPFAKDADGYWTGAMYFAFTSMVNRQALPEGIAAFKATDLLDPKFKDKIILTYPNDDDAVLFGFKLLVDKYGWDWLEGIAAQKPAFVRGVPGSSAGVAGGSYLASIATASAASDTAAAGFDSKDPFVSWAQRAAIFKDAKHLESAKLFLSWLTSANTQKNAVASWTWSVRSDVGQPAWLKPITEYKNTDPIAFQKFMSDRGAAEQFRTQLELYLKPVVGADPASPDQRLGLTPGQ